MKTCANCHRDIPKGSLTCPGCGADAPKGFFAALSSLFGARAKPDAPTAVPPTTTATSSTAGTEIHFTVQDAFVITGRGTVASGRLSRGRIVIGDELKFKAASGKIIQGRVVGIERAGGLLKEASEGELVGLLFQKTIPLDVLVPGVVLERA